MANKRVDEEELTADDVDSSIYMEYTEESPVKKCYCGHKGPLEPDLRGFACSNCGYLLIER